MTYCYQVTLGSGPYLFEPFSPFLHTQVIQTNSARKPGKATRNKTTRNTGNGTSPNESTAAGPIVPPAILTTRPITINTPIAIQNMSCHQPDQP
ncbi:uncharacterized protein METZ01_LOCUS405456, partial [marine metagenome]